jgi:phosphoribosyl-ATP pyrophosphohydrolase
MNNQIEDARILENWDLDKGRYGYCVASTQVRDERIRQEELYSDFWSERQTQEKYLAKFTEEFLEVVTAVNDADEAGQAYSDEVLEELIHTLAVGMGWLQWELGARYFYRKATMTNQVQSRRWRNWLDRVRRWVKWGSTKPVTGA